MNNTRIYLDHAATTPLRDCARTAWLTTSSACNPGGQYRSGRRARALLEEARETIAELLHADPVEVIFTASGTEADNIALQGLYRTALAQHSSTRPDDFYVVSSPIEHPAVAETIRALSVPVKWLPVNGSGCVIAPEPSKIFDEQRKCAFVTCMWANNETGVIQPVGSIVDMSKSAGGAPIPVHVDAVQAVGHIPINFHESGVATLAASAHKFGGPRGVGLLLCARTCTLAPILHGGGQQRSLRPGTEDVAGAVATAAALKESCEEYERVSHVLARARAHLYRALAEALPDHMLYTRWEENATLPGHLLLTFPNIVGDSLLMLLDSKGIEASTGSACSAGVNRPSQVLLSMGVSVDEARSALRLTLGSDWVDTSGQIVYTETQIKELAATIAWCVNRARKE